MEPTPPKGTRVNKKFHRPFYETSRKTSAEIVSEARSSVRAFETKRPFTPAETNRTLFSGSSTVQENRPPSVCSGLGLSYNDSRPATGRKLSPIDSGVADLHDIEKRLRSVSAAKFGRGASLETINDENNNVSPSSPIHPQKVKKTSTVSTNQVGENPRVSSGPRERTPKLEREVAKQRSNSSGDLKSHESKPVESSTKARLSDHTVIVAEDAKTEQSDSLDYGCRATKDRNKESNGKRKRDPEKSAYFNSYIKPLLGQMELNKLHEDEDSLIVNFDVLWKTLEIGNMLGKSKLAGKQRSELLAVVYKCTSGDNVVLLLKLAKLFLKLEVTGKNLEAVCKLLLKVSRDKKHDSVFLHEDLIEMLLNLIRSPQTLLLSNLVYLAGTVKFLSSNNSVVEKMIELDVLSSISTLLQYTLDEYTIDTAHNKESCHMLVQVSSSLVNFASVSSLKDKFVSHAILQKVIALTETRYADSDYFLNVSRLLSKLSMDSNICHTVCQVPSNFKIIFNALKYNFKKPNISVRMCFSLGNIANHCADFRQNLAFDHNGIFVILDIAEHYLNCLDEKANGTKDIEDVLVKTIRVIANLSIDEVCGTNFSRDERLTNVLSRVFDINDRKTLSDELLISCATTLNNLSYYADDDSILMASQQQHTLGMVEMLLSSNINCVIEALRVLGNFTRSRAVRDILTSEEVFETIINLLDTNNNQVVFSTCGILINIMADADNRCQFKKFDGITKLIFILKECAETDWLLGGLVCQILWNFSDRIDSAVNCFGSEQADDLLTVLHELTEPDLALDYESHEDIDDNIKVALEEMWSRHFIPVASQLLRRIEDHHSDLEPIVSFPEQ